ncbi:MAG: hypothetical protein P9X27_03165 [Candidatus Kaelpia aquatica]|nr:hypothetical protein [Candidatus Kaelpia aquatica]
MSKEKKGFICQDCFKLKRCQEKNISWAFFFLALSATISIRAVNFFLEIYPVIVKTLWYSGIVGFLLFFAYKFRKDNILQRELKKSNLIDKVLLKQEFNQYDYEIVGALLCKLSSRKDKINYFFIFFTSVLVPILGLYTDFIK